MEDLVSTQLGKGIITNAMQKFQHEFLHDPISTESRLQKM